MRKAEFLEALETKLTGEVSENTIRQNLRYYNDYIDSAIRGGETEEQVLDELGSPLLIARTIIDTNGGQPEPPYGGNRYENTDTTPENDSYHSFHLDFHEKKTKWMIIGVLILILVLLFTVLRLLMPILLPLILVLVIIGYMKDGRR